jgi:hypothetical protein
MDSKNNLKLSKAVWVWLYIIFILIAIARATVQEDESYAICSSYSLSSYSPFRSNSGLFDASCRSGSLLVFKNRWMQMTAHARYDTATGEFKSKSNKLYIQFYGDVPDLPIALFDSDSIVSPSKECDEDYYSRESYLKRENGLEGQLKVRVRVDLDDYDAIAFIEYERANTSVYIRLAEHGFNFGIRAPKKWLNNSAAAGICVSGVKQYDKSVFRTLININLRPASQLCQAAFQPIKFVGEEAHRNRLLHACAEEVAASQNWRLAVDYRNAYLDYFDNFYADFYRPLINKFRKRLALVFFMDHVLEFQRKIVADNSSRKAYMQQTSCIDLEPSMERGDESLAARPAPEFRSLCASKPGWPLPFDLPHPSKPSLYIECYSYGRAYVKSCPRGFVYSSRFKCVSSMSNLIPHSTSHRNLLDFFTKREDTYANFTWTQTSTKALKFGDKKQPESESMFKIKKIDTQTSAEALEFSYKCKSQLLKEAASAILMPHPYNKSMYIICDKFSRPLVKKCHPDAVDLCDIINSTA